MEASRWLDKQMHCKCEYTVTSEWDLMTLPAINALPKVAASAAYLMPGMDGILLVLLAGGASLHEYAWASLKAASNVEPAVLNAPSWSRCKLAIAVGYTCENSRNRTTYVPPQER